MDIATVWTGGEVSQPLLFFFYETGEGVPLLIIYIYIYHVNYKSASIHVDIAGLCLVFARLITKANSFLKCSKQLSGWGCIPLKIKSLRCIQMHQFRRIIISVNNGTWSWVFSDSISVKGWEVVIWSCSLDQQVWANGHPKKRCSKSSSIPWLQQTQW